MKKSAVLCEQCSLIAHTRCATNAPPTCDLRSQLLLYAQYAENGTPNSPYTNPMEILAAAQAVSPTTPMSDAGFSSRPSLDVPSPSSSPYPVSPPTAFRVLAKFKRSHSSLNTNDSDPNNSSPTLANQKAVKHKRSVLRRNPASRERPPSISSSADRSSSMRSAATGTESLASRPDTIRQSVPSIVETESSVAGRSDLRLSKMTSFSGISATTERDESIPGNLPRESRHRKRDRDSKSSSNGCLVQ